MGLPREESEELLSIFHKSSRAMEPILSIEEYDPDTLKQLSSKLGAFDNALAVDQTITRIFVDWILLPQFQSLYSTSVSQVTFDRLLAVRSATDLSYPAEWFPEARAMKRKIIMHVGPTNSGKTHNALRALAAAETGVYAGPLRLLAHEIWDRLNKGQIIPLGVDPNQSAEPDDSSGTDIADGAVKAVITKQQNPRYVRACNLSTGEEQRIVAEDALLSCTVEMLPLSQPFDVAVIDEIQMISDESRGSGWTAALLGLCAKEIHLCGEETAVGLIEKLVQETGDELVVNRYERLTPLRVADECLEDLRNVRKGDCVVAFSRSDIFAIKNQIEKTTSLRCAVAYGRLPPEIRSEQAALFNDPNSGYDVMVGSDAIGMGLNLYVNPTSNDTISNNESLSKIKRIIFSAVTKFNGNAGQSVLSDSQMKQIAGRAGRYGLHGDSNDGGIATTLKKEDLPILREAMAAPISKLTHAGLPRNGDALENLSHALPQQYASITTLIENHDHLVRVREPYKLGSDNNSTFSLAALEPYSKQLTLADLMFWYQAPVQWRDPNMAEVARIFMRAFRDDLRVDLKRSLTRIGSLPALEEIQKCKGDAGSVRDPKNKLRTLETLHKSLVVYMWMALRNSVAFPNYLESAQLKEETEKAMDLVLQALTKGSKDGRKKVQVGGERVAYKNKKDFLLESQQRKADRVHSS